MHGMEVADLKRGEGSTCLGLSLAMFRVWIYLSFGENIRLIKRSYNINCYPDNCLALVIVGLITEKVSLSTFILLDQGTMYLLSPPLVGPALRWNAPRGTGRLCTTIFLW